MPTWLWSNIFVLVTFVWNLNQILALKSSKLVITTWEFIVLKKYFYKQDETWSQIPINSNVLQIQSGIFGTPPPFTKKKKLL